MKLHDLDSLLRAARLAPGASAPHPEPVAPAGFSRRVVRRWLEDTPDLAAVSWLQVSRQGLAVALAVMCLSVIWYARTSRSPVLIEYRASETVMLSLMPK